MLANFSGGSIYEGYDYLLQHTQIMICNIAV
jgi:hypothetical protein